MHCCISYLIICAQEMLVLWKLFAFLLLSQQSVGVCDELQRVDLEHHTWANYFLAAYKVCLFIHSAL